MKATQLNGYKQHYASAGLVGDRINLLPLFPLVAREYTYHGSTIELLRAGDIAGCAVIKYA